MSGAHDIAFLGASSIDKTTGAPLWEPYIPVGNDTADIEPFGPTDVFQSLGVSSNPWQKDDNGHAETVVLRHCGGKNAVCIGGRDTRNTKIYGKLGPGDTCVHTTGPEQAAMLLLKEVAKLAALLTKDSGGKSIGLSISGAGDKIQLFGFGCQVQLSSKGLLLAGTGGASIFLSDGKINFNGTPLMGMGVGANMCFALMPQVPPPTPAPGAPLPLAPALGIGTKAPGG
jgi:hypothetical protein